MWELDCEESWMLKIWCFWTVVLEKILESPLDCKEIQLVHPEGDQSWVFIGRTDAEAETPVLWPSHAKSWLIGKAPDAGRDWGQEEKGDDRGWDGWMASPTRWTWVWVNCGSLWWTGRPDMPWFMGSQSRTWLSDWTELNWVTSTNDYLDWWSAPQVEAVFWGWACNLWDLMPTLGRVSEFNWIVQHRVGVHRERESRSVWETTHTSGVWSEALVWT